jgi:hypothetical protein
MCAHAKARVHPHACFSCFSKVAVTVPSVLTIFMLLFILLLSDGVWVFMVTWIYSDDASISLYRNSLTCIFFIPWIQKLIFNTQRWSDVLLSWYLYSCLLYNTKLLFYVGFTYIIGVDQNLSPFLFLWLLLATFFASHIYNPWLMPPHHFSISLIS